MPAFFLAVLLSPALVFMTSFYEVQRIIPAKLSPRGDCLMVMGSKVLQNGEPDLMMKERVAKTLEVLVPSYKAIIVTGGSIDKKVVAESEVLKRLLSEGGVDEDIIFEESRSTSTYENLFFSKALVKQQNCTALDIVSHDFHLARIAMTAQRLGLPVNRLIGTEAKGRAMDQLLKREYVAYIVYWLGWDWVSR